DWLKLKPFKLNAIVLTPKAVNQIPTTGHAAKKKVLENQATEVTVCCNDVVGFFFLTELVTVVL
ncbi:hypothetical protein ISO4_03300, partial [Alcanivorax venustensis ISO4]|nr:hypothetical protein [Alloalcanivorax venustensis ISO4]